MTPLPQSGTAPRENVMHQLQLASILGFGGGEAAGIGGTAAGALGGLVLPGLLGRVAMSRPGQAYLSNQAMAGIPGLLASPQTALIGAQGFRGGQ
jgi:hypothetical protein